MYDLRIEGGANNRIYTDKNSSGGNVDGQKKKPDNSIIRSKIATSGLREGKVSLDDLKPFLKDFDKRSDNLKQAFQLLDKMDDSSRNEKGTVVPTGKPDGYINAAECGIEEGYLDLYFFYGNGENLINEKSTADMINFEKLDCTPSDVSDIFVAMYDLFEKRDSDRETIKNDTISKFKQYNLPQEVLEGMNKDSIVEKITINGESYKKVTTKYEDSISEILVNRENQKTQLRTTNTSTDSDIKEMVANYNDWGVSCITTKYKNGQTKIEDFDKDTITTKFNDSQIDLNGSDERINNITLNKSVDNLRVNIKPVYSQPQEEGEAIHVVDLQVTNAKGEAVNFNEKEKLISMINQDKECFFDYQLKVSMDGNKQNVTLIENKED